MSYRGSHLNKGNASKKPSFCHIKQESFVLRTGISRTDCLKWGRKMARGKMWRFFFPERWHPAHCDSSGGSRLCCLHRTSQRRCRKSRKTMSGIYSWPSFQAGWVCLICMLTCKRLFWFSVYITKPRIRSDFKLLIALENKTIQLFLRKSIKKQQQHLAKSQETRISKLHRTTHTSESNKNRKRKLL